MNRKVLLISILLMTCAIGVTAWWFYSRNSEVSPGRVFVSGNIEATEVDLSFRLSGQITTLPVKEGDRVTKDQIIASLDTDTLEALRRGAQADIDTNRAVLDQLEEGTRKEQIEALRALYKAAESRMKNATDEFNRYAPLYREGAISKSTYDSRETALRVATEEYNNALERLSEAEKGPREQEIRAARERLERAKWELARIKLDIDHSVLTTPVTGVVLVKSNEPGEVVLPGATVATVAEIDEVWLKGYVGESDLGRIKLGQSAEITTDTFPGKIYAGIVTFISARAEFTPKNVQTKEERVKQVYRVKITIPNLDQELKIGMPAEGHIVTDRESAKNSKETGVAKPR
jgi:HlyD family secretion protein